MTDRRKKVVKMSFTNTHRIADRMQAQALQAIKNDYDGLVGRYNECMDQAEWQNVANFIARVLEWYDDEKDKRHWLYEMFRSVVDLDAVNFAKDLNSFIGNTIMDDSFFVISWRKPDYLVTSYTFEIAGVSKIIPRKTLQYERGEIKMQATAKDDPEGVPEIEWASDSNPDCSQNVQLLMEAMDIHETRQNERSTKMEEFEQKRLLFIERLKNPSTNTQ